MQVSELNHYRQVRTQRDAVRKVKEQMKDFPALKQKKFDPIRTSGFVGHWSEKGFKDSKNITSSRMLAAGFSSIMSPRV
jgi:hypothetical protein